MDLPAREYAKRETYSTAALPGLNLSSMESQRSAEQGVRGGVGPRKPTPMKENIDYNLSKKLPFLRGLDKNISQKDSPGSIAASIEELLNENGPAAGNTNEAVTARSEGEISSHASTLRSHDHAKQVLFSSEGNKEISAGPNENSNKVPGAVEIEAVNKILKSSNGALTKSSSYTLQQNTSHQEKKKIEPPKNIPSAPRRFVQNRVPDTHQSKMEKRMISTSSAPKNEFQDLKEDELQDLREWLEMTDYYDEEYRLKKLQRRRRLAAIEREREELMKDEQEELGRRSNNSLPTPHLRSDPSPANSVYPPSPKPAERHEKPAGPFIHPSRTSSLKHDLSKKLPVQPAKRRCSEREEEAEIEHQDYSNLPRDIDRSSSRTLQYGWNADSTSGNSPTSKEYGGATRGRGQAKYFEHQHEESGRRRMSTSEYEAMAAHYPAPQVARYFVIKAFTLSIILDAQETGSWVTPERNMRKYAEAFSTTDDVFLFFSANGSKAFQGYARMSTAPGDASVSKPLRTEADMLKWKNNPAFGLEWLSTSEIPFARFAHLNNEYNDGSHVFFSRDGQELDPVSGWETRSIFNSA